MTILCYGDSNTYGYDPRGYFGGRYEMPWPEALSELTGWEVRNHGSCGRRVPVQESAFLNNFDRIIVMLGTNDLLNGEAPGVIAEKMAHFLSNYDPSRLVLLAPPPLRRGEWVPDDGLIRRSEELAERYREVAKRMHIRFLDAGEWKIPLCYDGVHFLDMGHRMLAQSLVRALRKIDCISVANMRDSDGYTIANFVPSLELMHRAAMGIFLSHNWQGKTAIVVGSGNNGGDGFALACILKERGLDSTVFTLSDRLSPDSAHYAGKARSMGIPICPFVPGCLDGFETLVDCLLGTGFQGAVRDNYRTAIEEINESRAFILSADIISGMNGDSGAGECIVRSDLTVTIGFVKHGLVTGNAGAYMKRLVCADIGITLLRQERRLSPKDCPPWLEPEILFVN